LELALSIAGTFDKNWAMSLFIIGILEEILFCAKLCLELLKIQEELLFQLLPGVYAFWSESGVPVCYGIL
jgi:hypothetical protein